MNLLGQEMKFKTFFWINFHFLLNGKANIFYPEEQIQIYRKVSETKQGLKFPISFPGIQEPLRNIEANLNTYKDLFETTLKVVIKEPSTYPSFAAFYIQYNITYTKYSEILKMQMKVGETARKLTRIPNEDPLCNGLPCELTIYLPYAREVIQIQALADSFQIVTEGFKKNIDKLYKGQLEDSEGTLITRGNKGLELYANEPSFELTSKFFENLRPLINDYYQQIESWSIEIIEIIQYNTVASSLKRRFVKWDNSDDSQQSNLIEYKVLGCGFHFQSNAILCPLRKIVKTDRAEYIKFRPFPFHQCTLDISYISKSIVDDKYHYSKELDTLTPISKQDSCFEGLEDNNKEEIINHCPKGITTGKYYITSYGILLNEISSHDISQFKPLLTDQHEPPVFLRLEGARTYTDSKGSTYHKNFISNFEEVIVPDMKFTGNEICPTDSFPETWGTYLKKAAPASFTFLGISTGIFSLIYFLKKLCKKPWRKIFGRGSLNGGRTRRPNSSRILAIRQRNGR